MPTMKSINMHPSLRHKLTHPGETNPNNITNKDKEHIKTSNISNDVQLPIRTPQALLSRDPSQIASCLGINNDEEKSKEVVYNLRSAVSDALIMDENVGHGREACMVVAEVSQAILDHSRRREGLKEGKSGNKRNREQQQQEEKNERKRVAFHDNRRPPIVMGAVTALDMSLYNSLLFQKDDNHHNNTLQTGSIALDSLFSSDSSKSLSSCHISFDSVLPNTSINTSSSSSSSSPIEHPNKTHDHTTLPGVEFGSITEIHGPSSSGKTQLALSLATHAAITGHCSSIHYLAAGGAGASVAPLARRIRQLCRSRFLVSEDGGRERVEKALERIRFTTVPDGFRALAALERIRSKMVDEEGNVLIIFDSISGCLAPNLYWSTDGGYGASLAFEVGLALRKLARSTITKRRIAVFVTNGSSSTTVDALLTSTKSTKQRTMPDSHRPRSKPALGNMWKSSDVRVRLEALGDDYLENDEDAIPGLKLSSRRVIGATLEKHWCKRISKGEVLFGKFGIDASGIVDVDVASSQH